ncbi:hypothetical protein SO802_015078 [Lithocarpus litseifolius]|uniref:DUF8040 domain-containing protein n=1 Tax=Lithocarpus litseifolius TaxID=425828 RepID=A0AAW2CSQ1_9ROSI
MVLSLLGVHLGHYLHLFSTFYFMEKDQGRHMFAILGNDKDVQLKWLEMQYQRLRQYGYNGTRRVCLEESLAMTLLVLGHAEGNRIVQDRFQHSGETMHNTWPR